METEDRKSGRSEPFAAILYAEPGALGLICNIASAFITAIGNIIYSDSTNFSNTVSGVHLVIIGGFLQMVAGFLCFRRNDHLTGTAFFVFSTLWTFQGITSIISTGNNADIVRSILPVLLGFILIALSLFVCSLFVNFIIPPVLIAMVLTLTFESVGLFYEWGRKVAAAFEFVIVLTALYAVVVMTTKGVSQRYILPGFGNAPIDPLLIKRKVSKSTNQEMKKNTKYAEPMGLGYLGNIIPPLLISFHHFGYFSNFSLAFGGALCGFILQIFASYYAFLRTDCFNCVQFVVHFIFWTSKSCALCLDTLGYDMFSSAEKFYGSWGMVLVLFLLTVFSSSESKVAFLYNVVLTFTSVMAIDHIPKSANNYTFGVSAVITVIVSAYISTAYLLNSIAEKPVLYVGSSVISESRLRTFFKKDKLRTHSSNEEKKIHAVSALFFLCNSIAAISLSPSDVSNELASLPLLLVAGIMGNLVSARLSYTVKNLIKTHLCIVCALAWACWSFLLFKPSDTSTVQGASIAVLGTCTLSVLAAISLPKIWLMLLIAIELNIISLVTEAFEANNSYFPQISSLIVGCVGLYGVLVYISKGIIGASPVPDGHPILKERKVEPVKTPCPTFRSRIVTDITKAAGVLDTGDVIGIPTDTVYALAGSCKHPESVSKIYHIKGRPPEKPICLCISDLDQLKIAKPPFSPLLWKFMDLCYPGGITCVVRKGDWLQNLGVGKAVEYVGTKDSVAIRVPDSSVLSYLVSITGPIAITSANPSGEPDSLHHNTVIDTLGDKLAGVLCDDESNESVASTVVNCMKIDEGEMRIVVNCIGCICVLCVYDVYKLRSDINIKLKKSEMIFANRGTITYFRIGCTPQEIVDHLFERAKAEIHTE